MKSITPGLLFLLLKLFLTSNLFAQNQNESVQKGLAAIVYGDIEGERPQKLCTINELNSENIEWNDENHWSLRCVGFIKAPISGEITIYTETDYYIRFHINKKKVLEANDRDKSHSVKTTVKKGKTYPCEIYYVHDGGKSYLRFYWSWEGQPLKHGS